MALTRVLVPMPGYVKGRVIGNSILVGIMLLVVSLRIVARLVTGSRLGWDDYFILVAVPQAVGLLVCQGLCELPRGEQQPYAVPTLSFADPPRRKGSTAGAGYENIMDVPAENTQFVGLVRCPRYGESDPTAQTKSAGPLTTHASCSYRSRPSTIYA